MQSIVVIDGDEIVRRGLAHAIDEVGRAKVIDVLDHRQALEWDGEWADVDLVLLDSGVDEDAWDRVIGVEVARHIRGRAPVAPPTVVAAVDRQVHELVLWRMLEAGANRGFRKDHHQTLHRLTELVLAEEPPPPVKRTAAQSLALDGLGLTDRSNINLGIDFVRENQLEQLFDGDQTGFSRRQLITIRTKLGGVMQVSPSNPITGALNPPKTANWRQLELIINLARGQGYPT